MKGIFVSFFFIFFYFVNGQNFANKRLYLIDSLVLNKVNKQELFVIDSCLTAFHKTTADSSKVNIINHIVESSYDNTIWPKYNQWIYDFSNSKLSNTNDITYTLLYSKYKAGAINNFGYLNQIQGDNKRAIRNYNKSLAIYQNLKDSIGVANSLNNIGSVHYYKGDAIESLRLYHQSLTIRKLIHDDFGVANSLNNIGNIFRENANYPEAIEYFLESLKIRLSLKNEEYLSTLYHNIGLCYLDLNDTKNALLYFNISLDTDTKFANSTGIGTALSSIARCHQKKHEYKKALSLFEESLVHFKKSKSKKEIGVTINALAETKLALHHNPSDITELYNQSLLIFNDVGYPEGKAITYKGLTELHLSTSKLDQAIVFGQKFLEVAKQINSKLQKQEAYILLSKIIEKKSRFKDALNYSKLASVLKDSITQKLAKNALDVKQLKFQFEQDLSLAENDYKHQLTLVGTKNDLQRRVITISLIGLILIGVLLIILFNKLRANKKQKEEINHKNNKLNSMYAVVQKSLDEKTFLLKEIHHRVKNNLQVISSLLRMQSKYTNEKTVKELLKSSQSRVNSMALIHEKLYQVDDLSLINYNNYVNELVRKLIDTYNKEDIKIDFKFNSEPLNIAIETAIPLGLLLNEIISNSLKHAFKGQQNAEIHLDITHVKNNTYSLSIGDNGVGFKEYLNYKDTESLGVMLVQKMTRQLSGTIEKCTLNKGTHYNITFQNN